MKLYYSPGTCSLSPHITLREAGIAVELVKVNLAAAKTEGGDDYLNINSKGYVPLLELDSGERLSEGPAIVQYIADLAPTKNLAPANGTLARYRLQEWLNFITSELHKGFGPLFTADMPEQAKTLAKTKLAQRLSWVNDQLEGRKFLLGDTFTVADAYLFTVASWGKHVGVDIALYAHLSDYMSRVASREAVREALKAEGLLK